jgi:hypothetical protein
LITSNGPNSLPYSPRFMGSHIYVIIYKANTETVLRIVKLDKMTGTTITEIVKYFDVTTTAMYRTKLIVDPIATTVYFLMTVMSSLYVSPAGTMVG